MSLPRLREIYPYAMTDQGFNLRGLPISVTVAWNKMPIVGVLRTKRRRFSGELWFKSHARALACCHVRFGSMTPWLQGSCCRNTTASQNLGSA